MRPAWPARLTASAARQTARLLLVVLTAAGLTIAYGLSRSAPADMCAFADYPAGAALAAPGTPTGGQHAGEADGETATQATGLVAHAAAQPGDSGVPAPGDQDGGVLQVCAALLAVLVMLAFGATRPRSRRFLYEPPRPLGPPLPRTRRRRALAGPSLATLQILRV